MLIYYRWKWSSVSVQYLKIEWRQKKVCCLFSRSGPEPLFRTTRSLTHMPFMHTAALGNYTTHSTPTCVTCTCKLCVRCFCRCCCSIAELRELRTVHLA